MQSRIILTITMMMLGLNAFAQKIVLTPQWTAQSQFAGYYVAKEMGFYKEAGVDVDIRHMTTSEIALNRLQDDKCNAITMMLFDAIYHVSRGVEIVNILQTAQRSGHVIVVRDDEIKDVKDLKGKRLGVWRRNFNQLLRIIDEEVLLGVEWVPFVQSINLYISGAVDATMAMTYNEIYHINASGYEGKTVISMAELGYDYPEDGLYVTREYYEKYPDKAQAFADASRRGWEWAHEHPEETLDIVLKVMEREHLPSSRKHQEWMLREILNQQCAEGESTPSFTLDPDIYSKLNELFIRHSRIEDEVSIDKIQGR